MPATEGYLRNIKSMHQVFCLSAVVLLVCTVWMMWADYDDEWRHFQREALSKIAKRDRKLIDAIKSDPKFEQTLESLTQEKASADSALKVKEGEKAELDAAAKEAAIAASNHMRNLREARAVRDVARAEYG